MKKKELLQLQDKVQTFLYDYAKGKYGRTPNYTPVTRKMVNEFLTFATEKDLKEILKYATPKIIAEMIKDKGTKNEGAPDLEDYIEAVLIKNKI